MGPYCKFCNQRCFQPKPTYSPKHISDAYGDWGTIMATCSAGRKYEKEKFGYCIDDAVEAHNILSAKAENIAVKFVSQYSQIAQVLATKHLTELCVYYLAEKINPEYMIQELQRTHELDNFHVIKLIKLLEEEKKNGCFEKRRAV